MEYFNIMFFSSFFLLTATWLLYPSIIFLISKIRKPQNNNHSKKHKSPISIIIAAHNEEQIIAQRIKNIFSGTYPMNLLEVIITSDGSTDSTVAISQKLSKEFPIKVIDIQPQRGRANAHNAAAKIANGNILVFTDADTIFDKLFLDEIIKAFNNQKVGFASGCLKYINKNKSTIQKNVNFYWKFELWLRKCESKIGLLSTGTGACCAVRKSLFREIPATGDVDFTTPLDVIKNGYLCKYVPTAVAFDYLPSTKGSEFKARVRMTTKNFHGTLVRWGITNLILHPLYSVSIFFHKIFRWLTPHLMIMLLISNIYLCDISSFYSFAFIIQIVFYCWGILGFFKIHAPYSGMISNFLLANIAFFYGVNKALLGKVPRVYKPIRQ